MRNAPVKRDDSMRYQLSPIKLEQQIKNYSYFLTDVLGKGYSSVVYKGLNRTNGTTVAIKIVDLSKIDTPVKKALLFNETRFVCGLNHPNLLKSIEVFQTKGHTFLISEYCDDGDLARMLKIKRKLPVDEAFQIFHQLLLGLKSLRQQKVIHRDIKPANIMFKSGTPKIIDFGFSTKSDIPVKEKFNVGTPLYMAPEVIQHNIYSEKSDMWALGMVLFEMIHGKPPFSGQNEVQILQQQLQHPQGYVITEAVDQKVEHLIEWLLKVETNQRYSVEQAINYIDTLEHTKGSVPKYQRKFLSLVSTKRTSFHYQLKKFFDETSEQKSKNQPSTTRNDSYQQTQRIKSNSSKSRLPDIQSPKATKRPQHRRSYLFKDDYVPPNEEYLVQKMRITPNPHNYQNSMEKSQQQITLNKLYLKDSSKISPRNNLQLSHRESLKKI